jgi:hypothetical protein
MITSTAGIKERFKCIVYVSSWHCCFIEELVVIKLVEKFFVVNIVSESGVLSTAKVRPKNVECKDDSELKVG